jgi:hypothetical protein
MLQKLHYNVFNLKSLARYFLEGYKLIILRMLEYIKVKVFCKENRIMKLILKICRFLSQSFFWKYRAKSSK